MSLSRQSGILTERMKCLSDFIRGEWQLRERFEFKNRIVIDAKAPRNVRQWEMMKLSVK